MIKLNQKLFKKKFMFKKMVIFSLLIGFLSASSLMAQAKKRAKKSTKVVNVDFDDELHIKGKLLGPSIFTLYQKKNLNYGKLIQPRKNFLPEMRETLKDIN